MKDECEPSTVRIDSAPRLNLGGAPGPGKKKRHTKRVTPEKF